MQMRAKKTLLKIAVAVALVFVAMCGISRFVSSSDAAAISCNPGATTIDDAVCLQDMNDAIRAGMEVDEQRLLIDSRDEKSYWITKLSDGSIWMTQNLELGNAESTIALNPDNTDIGPDSAFSLLPVAETTIDFDNDKDVEYFSTDGGYIMGGGVWITTSGSFARDIVRSTGGSGHYRLGNGYPWTIATAQTADYVDPLDQEGINFEPSDSICPAGWRLPSQNDYKSFLVAYDKFEENDGSEDSWEISASLRLEPFYFVRGFPYQLGTEGHYWTSTTSFEENHYVARVFFLSGHNSGSSYKTDELSGAVGAVRCVARPDSSFTYTLSYNMNSGDGTIADDVISSSHKQVSTTVSSTEPTRAHYAFKGWAESSSATTASYSGGDTITLGKDKTLYAVWEVVVSDQTVSFEQSSVSKTFGDSDFTNAATTTGDGAITYSSNNTGVAEVNSNTGKVTIKGAGTATITANAAATTFYRAASDTYTLTVSKAEPTISFVNVSIAKTYGDAKFINAATTISDGTISYQSSNTAVATVDSASGEVTIVGAGEATITATVAATSNYESAAATYTLTVSRYATTIAFANMAVIKTYGDAKFINAATTISDGTISYQSSNTAVATVDSVSGEVTIAGAGEATITATVAATSNYESAAATYVLTVNKKTSTAPAEVSETKNGYVTDALSTIPLNTVGLTWSDSAIKITEGYNGYAVTYTENADTHNYTTESFEITVHGERRSYEVIEGDGQVYTLQGDKEIIRFKVGADYGLFENGGLVYVNGTLLDTQYYTAEADGEATMINLSHDYLETLAVDEYALSIYFNDGGVAETTFVVEKAAETDDEEEEDVLPVPDTGSLSRGSYDAGVANTLLCVLPGGVVAGMLAAVYVCRVKRSHRKFEW